MQHQDQQQVEGRQANTHDKWKLEEQLQGDFSPNDLGEITYSDCNFAQDQSATRTGGLYRARHACAKSSPATMPIRSRLKAEFSADDWLGWARGKHGS